MIKSSVESPFLLLFCFSIWFPKESLRELKALLMNSSFSPLSKELPKNKLEIWIKLFLYVYTVTQEENWLKARPFLRGHFFKLMIMSREWRRKVFVGKIVFAHEIRQFAIVIQRWANKRGFRKEPRRIAAFLSGSFIKSGLIYLLYSIIIILAASILL